MSEEGRQIGCLGDIIFSVSSETVTALNNVVWSGEARYAIHHRHLSNALVEITGLEPDTITFDIFMSADLGVDVSAEIVKIWIYERTGEAIPLAIGERWYGKYRWVIQKHKMKFQTFDREGTVSSATVSITLLEYTKV